MERAVCLLIGYLCGLFQSGYIYGKIKGVDIRNYGSGNSGATNASRVLGKKAGGVVFLGDCLKCTLACLIAKLIFNGSENRDLFTLYAGFGAMLGHCLPFYLKFKGGKAAACLAGLLFAFDWRSTLICALLFLSLALLTRYVSLGSICAAAGFSILTVSFALRGDYAVMRESMPEFVALTFIISAFIIWRHRANIKRLLSGTENKLFSRKD